MGVNFSEVFPLIWSILVQSQDYSAFRARSHNGIVIALVGRSGSGISKFIHDATWSYGAGVSPEGWHRSHNEPYTATIQDFGFTISDIDYADFPLVLVDTPGFDYADNGDEHAALRRLLAWLETFKPGVKLDGLLLMQSVCADEFGKQAPYKPRGKVVQKLCGEDWQEKVILVTSHWESLAKERKESKEADINNYWSYMMNHTSRTEQYNPPGHPSAWRILIPLVERAVAAREERLRMELQGLRRSVPLTDDLHNRITVVLKEKTSFIRGAIARLGTAQVSTDVEKQKYGELSREAQLLWKEVKNEINIPELERLLTAGIQMDEGIKVAVVGSTGSGISQFIHDVTGEDSQRIGPPVSLTPFTKEIEAIEYTVPTVDSDLASYPVTLIDTPGFDFSDVQNDEYSRFQELSSWVRRTYGLKAKLDWVIYIHNVQNAGLDHRRAFHTCRALEELCEEEWFRQIVFVSSHWTQSAEDEARERGIREGYWRLMARRGSRMERYNSSPGSDYGAKVLLQSILQL